MAMFAGVAGKLSARMFPADKVAVVWRVVMVSVAFAFAIMIMPVKMSALAGGRASGGTIAPHGFEGLLELGDDSFQHSAQGRLFLTAEAGEHVGGRGRLFGGLGSRLGQPDIHAPAIRIRRSTLDVAAALKFRQEFSQRLRTDIEEEGQILLSDFRLHLQKRHNPSLTAMRIADRAVGAPGPVLVPVKQFADSGELRKKIVFGIHNVCSKRKKNIEGTFFLLYRYLLSLSRKYKGTFMFHVFHCEDIIHNLF